jgi:hypothetical protein
MKSILLIVAAASCVTAQSLEIKVGKRSKLIPKVCESVVPASLEGQLDVQALLKEVICKGAGDAMTEYTYVHDVVRREKKRTGIEQKTWTYEVFIPTLKSGIRTKGILLLISQDGVAVPPDELEKARVRAAHKLEDEEAKISQKKSPAETKNASPTGMLPIGSYLRLNRAGSAVLDVNTFLKNVELTFLRRETLNGRETLVFRFSPRPNAQFQDKEKYIAQLTGEISIDATDHILTRLVAWPVTATAEHAATQNERPPAVNLEMQRLNTGVWLPALTRINGVDYPELFLGNDLDVKNTYTNYIRFSTELKDVQIDSPKP